MASDGRPTQKSLEAVFQKYASVEMRGQHYMSERDFVSRYLQLLPDGAPDTTVSIYCRIADTTGDGLVSFEEFAAFESLLRQPNADSLLAFRLFDQERKGRITFNNFQSTLSQTVGCQRVPFDFASSFVSTYFGPKRTVELDYFAFTQLLQNLPSEHAHQAFVSEDSSGMGAIPAVSFVELMRKTREHKLSPFVNENLLAVMRGEGRQINYAYFKAFNQMLNNLDLLEEAVAMATEAAAPHTAVTMDQVQAAARKYPQVTPLQVSLMFQLLNSSGNVGYVRYGDFHKLLPQGSRPQHEVGSIPQQQLPGQQQRTLGSSVAQGLYRFALAAVGGATGATAVYPIDLVKTRLQNQRGSIAGEIMYRNSFDCFRKVIRYEGVFGLYRGLLPQLMGVSPEKAIKLTVNDTVRDLLTNKKGELPFWKECIAGGCGGASQVTFTNPIEIVKIRLQVAGEMGGGKGVGVVSVVRELGFMGLYKGASACLVRDIPFSAIYFPAYAHMKLFTANKEGRNGPTALFVSAFTAGVPAAGLLTPADVIKTRLQVKARSGQQTYKGIVDCARKIYNTEGGKAFWKGAPARIFRSSPQFGVTLLTYELLQRVFPANFGPKKGAPVQPVQLLPLQNPDFIGGFGMARPTFAAAESRYGLVFAPRMSAPPPQ